jgi:VanZ family protein
MQLFFTKNKENRLSSFSFAVFPDKMNLSYPKEVVRMNKLLRTCIIVLPVLYMAVIWILSGLPDTAVVELPDHSVDRFFKESMHLVEFAILYLFFAAALAAGGKLTPALSGLAALAAGMYGIMDEIHQFFVPYRNASLIDVLKDFIGVAAAYFHVRYHYFKHNRGFLTLIGKLNKK